MKAAALRSFYHLAHIIVIDVFLAGAAVWVHPMSADADADADRCAENSVGRTIFELRENTEELTVELVQIAGAASMDVRFPVVPFGNANAGLSLVQLQPSGNLSFHCVDPGCQPDSLPSGILLSGCEGGACGMTRLPDQRNGASRVLVRRTNDGEGFLLTGDRPNEPRAIGTIDGTVIGGGVSDDDVRIVYLRESHLFERRLATDGTLGTESLLGEQAEFPHAERVVNLHERDRPALVMSSASLILHELDEKSPTPRVGAEFHPYDWPWNQNYEPADLNGDGFLDFVAYAAPSRHLWASLGSRNGFFETPVRANMPGGSGWKIAAAADFTGDGMDDVVLYDRMSRRWLLGISRSATALRETVLQLPHGSVRTGKSGAVCAADDSFRPGERLQTSRGPFFVVRNDVGVRSSHRVLLRRIIRNGGKFSTYGESEGPFICTGFASNVDAQIDTARTSKWGTRYGVCPPGYAFFSTGEPRSRQAIEYALPWSACCPLPNDDVLVGSITETALSCPEDSIAVGGTPGGNVWGPVPRRWLCQGISNRYQLGAPHGGIYFGLGYSVRGQPERIRTDRIPAAIRIGISRNSLNGWYGDGCVGAPPGTLLTGRKGDERGCARMQFRELQYRGGPGDPAKGTPVVMFPQECAAIDDPYRTTARCVGNGRSESIAASEVGNPLR